MKYLTKILICFFAAALLVNQAYAQYAASDPTALVPNARVLGLGKAFIGVAEGTGAIFTNPAGLAEAANWQLTSMSGKFLDEYTYLSFAGIYPTNMGVIGFGFAGTSIGGAFATTIEAGSDPADPIYTIDPSEPQMGNNNNAFVVSYANKLNNFDFLKQVPYADKLALGTSLKLFSASVYGDSITGGDASGMDMDLGLKFYPEQKWMKFGATLQNLLPSSLGGKLTYATGHTESYPAIIELGSVFTLIGKNNGLYKFGETELNFMLDLDTHPTLQNYPMVMHTALEWKPLSLLAIRFGIDQDANGNGSGGLETVSDNAFGVGLSMSGFNFDYAYHTFAGSPNIDNHYFSLSYSSPLPAVSEFKKPIAIDIPADRLITFESNVPVVGRVLDPSVRKLTINDLPLKFTLQGDFSTVFDLNIGKNKIRVNSEEARVLRLVTFPDVAIGYWVDKPISLLAMSKIITGYPDGTFRPEGNITRAEMCTLLMKTTGSEVSRAAPANFKDITAKHWAARYVGQAAKLGIVKGYPDGTFRPNGNITRAEGLAMIARFDNISEEAYNNEFPDVNDKAWAARIIAGASKAGILQYLAMKPFEPNRQLTRAETVEMLYRTAAVKELLRKDLLNWDSY